MAITRMVAGMAVAETGMTQPTVVHEHRTNKGSRPSLIRVWNHRQVP